MARYAVIKDGNIDNVIELEPDNYTTTFVVNDLGDKLPTTIVNGVPIVSTVKWLVPENCTIFQSDDGEIGDPWPLT